MQRRHHTPKENLMLDLDMHYRDQHELDMAFGFSDEPERSQNRIFTCRSCGETVSEFVYQVVGEGTKPTINCQSCRVKIRGKTRRLLHGY